MPNTIGPLHRVDDHSTGSAIPPKWRSGLGVPKPSS
jgi:hypothetical protein